VLLATVERDQVSIGCLAGFGVVSWGRRVCGAWQLSEWVEVILFW
jgi:hypothetical protein